MSDDEYVAPERDLIELSLRLKMDVLWFSFQSVVDPFSFTIDPRELEHLLEDIDEFMESEDEKRGTERIWRDAQKRPGHAETSRA